MKAARKTVRRRRPSTYVAAATALVAGLVFAFSAAALPGSNFEITDGNLIVNGAPPALDWANVNEQRQTDTASGSNDDAFGQGTKEDTPIPSVVSGSIPNNKSDLLNFGVYLEENASGRFLNLFWRRVQEPNGTTNMDFEFNKSKVISANGVTPVRTEGDVLIQYDLSQGGTNPTLWASRWVTSGAGSQCEANNAVPCWNTRVNLTAAGIAAGSINLLPISAADSDGLGAMSARTFGEAQVDLDALQGGGGPQCAVFGSAYLKSRSSDSFNAELKDFIAPEAVDLDQCATVIIRKITDPVSDPASVRFGYTKAINTAPASANTFTLGHGENKSYDDVLFGNGYTVVEDVLAANWEFVGIDCSASSGVTPVISGTQITFDIDSKDDILDCTYTNRLRQGAILITKTRKHAATPLNDAHAGVNFTVNGVTKVTDANGQACFDGLAWATYTVHEEVPAGYSVDANDKSVTVDNNAKCSDSPYGGETVAFHNTPLTDITVSVNSQVDGGTASTIDCGDAGDPVSTGANGDGSKTKLNLEPGTYVCTIVVDP